MVYGENSILLKKFDYKKISDECGYPVCVSDNGLNIVFQQYDFSGDVYLVSLCFEKGLQVMKKIDIK